MKYQDSWLIYWVNTQHMIVPCLIFYVKLILIVCRIFSETNWWSSFGLVKTLSQRETSFCTSVLMHLSFKITWREEGLLWLRDAIISIVKIYNVNPAALYQAETQNLRATTTQRVPGLENFAEGVNINFWILFIVYEGVINPHKRGKGTLLLNQGWKFLWA